jgi:hypothetical protein
MNKTAEQMMEEFETALDKHSKETLMLELSNALNKIEFLHGCLTDKTYKYAYPEMTIEHIKRLRNIIPERHYCLHSFFDKNCASCKYAQILRQYLKS